MADSLNFFFLAKIYQTQALPFSLVLAQYAFADPNRVIAEDLGHSHREKRYYCFGRVEEGIMTVRFTYRGDMICIFGAGYWRKGRKIYEKENQVHR